MIAQDQEEGSEGKSEVAELIEDPSEEGERRELTLGKATFMEREWTLTIKNSKQEIRDFKHAC